jgi:hypothetical protein
MKTARLQVLTTPAFRDWLRKEARNSGVSVAELVRTRCEQRVGDEETVLAELTALLRKEVTATRAATWMKRMRYLASCERDGKQLRRSAGHERIQ